MAAVNPQQSMTQGDSLALIFPILTSSGAPLLEKTISSGVSLTQTGGTWQATVVLYPTDTANLTAAHFCQLRIVDGSVSQVVATVVLNINPALNG